MTARPRWLAPHAITARRRAGLLVALHLARTSVAALLALPFAGLVARLSGSAHDDARLLDGGAIALVEVARLGRAGLLPMAGQALAAIALAGVVGVLPLGVVLHALARRGRPTAADLGAFATRRAPALLALLGLFLAVEASVVGFGVTAASLASAPFERHVSVPAGDLAGVAITALACVAALGIGVVHDLARAATVRLALPPLAAISLAAATLRAAPLRVGRAWASRSAAGLAIATVGLAASAQVGVSSAWARAGALALSEAAIFALFAARASWLARALRAVIERHGTSSDDV